MRLFLKNVFPLLSFLLSAGYGRAQWTAQDSLKLKETLKKQGEIELNPEAVRSIELNLDGANGGTFIGGDAGSTSLPDGFSSEAPQLYRQHLFFDETLPTSPFPQAVDTLPVRLRMSLRPYNGMYLYNYDPVTGQKLLSVTPKPTFGIPRPLFIPGGQPMDEMRLMMMGGAFGGSFKYDFNKVFNRGFWDFHQRRTARKTQVVLSTYDNPEQQYGRYEYFHISDEEYSLEFAGIDSVRSQVEVLLQEAHPVQKGLLYFKYTELCRGRFIYFLSDGTDVRGTFTTNGTRYTLLYDNREIVITFTRFGGKFYTLKRDVTRDYRPLYTPQEVEKIQVACTVERISAGRDGR